MFTSIDEVLRRPIEFTLAALVAVVDHTAHRAPVPHRQVEGVEHHLGA
jgi:hypothetical protein